MSPRESAVHFQRLAMRSDRLVELSCIVKMAADIRVDRQRKGFQLMRSLCFGVCFVKASHCGEHSGVPLMRGGIIGLKLYSSFEVLFGFYPIPIIAIADRSKRSVRFGKTF